MQRPPNIKSIFFNIICSVLQNDEYYIILLQKCLMLMGRGQGSWITEKNVKKKKNYKSSIQSYKGEFQVNTFLYVISKY